MEDEKEKKSFNGFEIVGLNLLAFVVYTGILLFLFRGVLGGLLDAIALLLHFFLCITTASGTKKWIWLLTGLVILSIGISICSRIDFIHGNDYPNK